MNTENHLRALLPPADLRSLPDEELESMLDNADNAATHAAGPAAEYLAALSALGHPATVSRAWWRRRDIAAVAALLLLAAIAMTVKSLDRMPAPVVDHPQVDPLQPISVGTPEEAGADDKLQVVRIKFPQPIFSGTPEVAKRPNLDRSKTPIRAFKAPSGTKLISQGCKVSSSDSEPIIGELEMVTDGDKDGADGSYVELGPDKQWVQIDLGAKREIWGIVVWHFHKKARAYDDVVVQFASDASFSRDVVTVLNNDHDNSSGFGVGKDLAWVETNHGRVIKCAGPSARYVRLYSNGNTANELNHYTEVEVYGR